MYTLIRHQDIFKPEQARPVFVIGCGATGSHVALQLFSMGITRGIEVIDFDTVEPHNLPNQIFMQKHLDMHKVDALRDYVQDKMGEFVENLSSTCFVMDKVPDYNIRGIADMREDVNPIVILAVDSMQARLQIVESLRGDTRPWRVIDTRMAASHGNIYSFDVGTQFDKWVATLIDDADAEVSPCGAPISCMPTTFIISGFAVWEYINQCVDPLACTEAVDLFMKPGAVNFSRL
jgi:molybdopterin/thiamine biosynthesis adenylyltransferase